MASKSKKTVEVVDDVDLSHISDAANALALADAELNSNTKQLALQLSYDGSLNPDALESGIRDSQERVTMELFHIGARLLLLKEQCAHGDFMERTERLGLSPRVSQQIMQVTLKFSNTNSNSHLQKIGKTKLLELLILDNDEIKELSEEGSVRGIKLDDVDRMSVRELRKQLRDAKAQTAGTQKLLAEKNQRIDELHTQINADKTNKPELVTPSMELQALLNEVGSLTDSICNTLISQFNSLFTRISDHHQVHGGSSMEVTSGYVNRIMGEVEELRGLFGLRASVYESRQEWDTPEFEDDAVLARHQSALTDADIVDGDTHTQTDWVEEE